MVDILAYRVFQKQILLAFINRPCESSSLLTKSCHLLYRMPFLIMRAIFLHPYIFHRTRVPNVLPHLFGFRGWDHMIFFTTPAATASFIINDSTASALSSFDFSLSSTIFYNCSINVVSYVWAVHIFADWLYSDIFVPSIHL